MLLKHVTIFFKRALSISPYLPGCFLPMLSVHDIYVIPNTIKIVYASLCVKKSYMSLNENICSKFRECFVFVSVRQNIKTELNYVIIYVK